MPAKRPEKKPIIVILVKRTVLFFFFLCVLAVYLYGLGTVQQFMDETQLLLLRLSVVLGLSLGVSSLYGIVLDIWLIFHKRKIHFLGGAGLYTLLVLLGFAIAALAVFIIAAAGGNRT